MLIWVTLWWLFFFSAVGLCLGSFLNVVIYRLPLDRSVLSPTWSACPNCRHRIRWYDNLPVLSYIRLGGRCRDCGLPISARYLVVEVVMALVVLMLIDAFFIGQLRSGMRGYIGLTDSLAHDWPILIAHMILFACLLAMSAIDMEHYWVDVRFTSIATICGFVLHALWTPRHSSDWIRPDDGTAAICLAALAGLGFVFCLLVSDPRFDAEDWGETEEEYEALEAKLSAANRPEPVPDRPRGIPGAVLVLAVFLALVGALLAVEGAEQSLPYWPRAIVPLALLFLLIVRQSLVIRESDQQIIEAIEEESPDARQMVLLEFGTLLPALILAGIVAACYFGSDDFASRVDRLLHAEIRIPGSDMFRRWQPIYGLGTAAAGFVIAGAIGWAVRIVFTLVFGREAFGAGDIHLMAAAGCIAGWPVVLLGFVLTCGLALLGWLITLPLKRTRAIPLGPWLSLSFLAVVVFYEPLLSWQPIARILVAIKVLFLENSQAGSLGL